MDESDHKPTAKEGRPKGILAWLIYFCLRNKLAVFLFVLAIVVGGIVVAPFDWETEILPRHPVPVDAIPDIGENQQIVFTRWHGRSPQDVEDQVSYPLTVAMLGIPKVKSVRSYSMFGFSSIYVIFDEDAEFYWSRSRVLEKLNSLPANTLPDGVQPTLGPDATALGQVFWYTLEGRDPDGNPAGGWDLHELRSIQDWDVRYHLLSAKGISEVASVGGFEREYQVDVDPDAMRAFGVSLQQVFNAVKMSNVDVGARTIEVNRVEYVIRGLGFIRKLSDIEDTVVTVNDNVPVYVRNVAKVSMGPALRRGILDKEGAETVGGVVVVRYGDNPLAAIKAVKKKIDEVGPGLPSRVVVDYRKTSNAKLKALAEAEGFSSFVDDRLNQDAWMKWLAKRRAADFPEGVTLSQVTIVPFYDRTALIKETLGTLETALTEEILVTIIVILVMVMNLRSSAVISLTLPLAVLVCFIAMKIFNVDANIVALSGIAIAIGTIVDMGVIVCENILKHMDAAPKDAKPINVVHAAVSEVAGAVTTAIATTIVGFLPVFTMIGAEGKLFRPLAFTKTFALLASVILALTVIPPLALVLFTGIRVQAKRWKLALSGGLVVVGLILFFAVPWWAAAIVIGIGLAHGTRQFVSEGTFKWVIRAGNLAAAVCVAIVLAQHWLPLGPEAGFVRNFIVVTLPIALLLGFFLVFQYAYESILRILLSVKLVLVTAIVILVMLGATVWLGSPRVLGWLPDRVQKHTDAAFPGLGKEFMPALDEGSYLYMPTTMPHASIGEAHDVLQKQDMAFRQIPEVSTVVGKLGRAESPLDPAPISMIETVINYKPEYLTDEHGRRLRFRFDRDKTDVFRDAGGHPLPAADGKPYQVRGLFERDSDGRLIPDKDGAPFRLWRPALDPALNPGRDAWPGIRNPDDIWTEIVAAGEIPGTTSAPRLQPISARLAMLQSGMRAPMGIKVKGSTLEKIEQFALDLEKAMKDVPGVEPAAVIADRIVGKPYLEIDINRKAIARYGIHIRQVQDVIEVAVGGKTITRTVEGRERYPVRVRYLRELRDTIESLGRVLVPAPNGQQIPLTQVAEIRYVRGPQVIKSEDTFLVGYVLFDKLSGQAEVDVVEAAERHLKQLEADKKLIRPAGVTYEFAGSYRNQLRAAKTLAVVLPLSLLIIFLLLYFQFRSVPTSLMVFVGIMVAWSGGFLLIWFYSQDWFLDGAVFDTSLRELFQISAINLSVAIWVGFLALFGIATDDGVVMATYLDQRFDDEKPQGIQAIRDATIAAAKRRIRPCLMTTATTILALLPVLTATGRGSDIMVPMAIPSFGGMLIELITLFSVPVLYCAIREFRHYTGWSKAVVNGLYSLGLVLLIVGGVGLYLALLASWLLWLCVLAGIVLLAGPVAVVLAADFVTLWRLLRSSAASEA